jgi:hypothetical protein
MSGMNRVSFMNPTTKTANEPEGILETIRANDSLGVRLVMDVLTGRFCKHCGMDGWEEDATGRKFKKLSRYMLDGYIAWEVNKWRAFTVLLADRKIGLNPRVLFRPVEVAPPQTAQTSPVSPA